MTRADRLPWSPEERLAIALCRNALGLAPAPDAPDGSGAGLLRNDIRWAKFLAFCNAERLTPMAHAGIRKAFPEDDPPGFPANVSDATGKLYYENAGRNALVLSELSRLCGAFGEKKISLLVLKGAHLAAAIYRNPAFRPMQDIDLMVTRPASPAAAALLESLGYSQEAGLPVSEMPENGTLNSVFFRPVGRIMPNVHLHWHIANASYPLEFYASAMDVGKLWARARPLGEPFAGAVCLAPEHLLLHLCEHAVKHCFTPLVLLCDMAATIRRFEIEEGPPSGPCAEDGDFMGRFISAAREFGLSRLAFHALSFCEVIFPETVPRPALARLRPGRASGMETAFARMVRANVRLPAQNWLLYLSMCPSMEMKTRFLRRALFPGREQLRALGNDPGGARTATMTCHLRRLLRGARLLYTGSMKL